MKNRNIVFTTIFLALGWFGLLQRAQAVVPAPDGGYGPPSYGPGNTAEGTDALFSLSSGYWNTALGFEALYHDTTGSINTATGVRALFSNTNGTYNVAYGYAALYDNTTGSFNTAYGPVALANNTTGIRNTATGFGALYKNDVGWYNTANGYAALYNNAIGSSNTATGYAALQTNLTGDNNTAIGYAALYKNFDSHNNTATGYTALYNNASLGSNNTATGHAALYSNNHGADNTATGSEALYYNTGGENTALGFRAGDGVTTAHNVICIGANVSGANLSNSCYIGSIFGRAASGGTAVFVTSSGRLGTLNSSRRFKEEIKPMDKTSEAIHALKPVTFRYEQEIDPQGIPQFGLVAEEVAKVNPDLVVRDEKGELCTVRYEAVNAMLLNEFLKEHRKVEQQQATIGRLETTAAKQEATIAQQRKDFEAAVAQQQQEIQSLTAQLKEQAARIQKVCAQIETTKFATGQIRGGGPAQPLVSINY